MRFPEFEGEWKQKRLGEIAEISSGGTPSRANSYYWNGNIHWVSTTLIDFNTIYDTDEKISEEGLKNSSAKIFPKGTLLMAMYGQGKTRGKIALLGVDAATNQACGAIMPNRAIINNVFLFQNLAKRYDEIRDLSNQGGQENLSGGIIKSIEVLYPSLPEQIQIASFLSQIDDRIQCQSKIIEDLQSYKSAVSKRIFSQELRFKDQNGNAFPKWEMKKLGDVCEEHQLKNNMNLHNEVFSVAKHKGVVNQIEHLGRSFSAKEISHYKLIFHGDLVYTKSPTSDFPFGIIKQSRTNRTGVVSPLYCVFRPKTFALGYFLHEYFSSSINVYNYLNPLVQKGAKNTMNINNNDFLNGAPILIPIDEREQNKIANFLFEVDEKINVEISLLQQFKLQKQYLLQQMFI